MHVKIADDVYWVGAVDWNLRLYHNTYSTHHGTSYNSYLIMDDKIALVDAVYGAFSGELVARINEHTLPERISYVVVNHSEPDHSGALPAIMELAPEATILCTAKCRDYLERLYYPDTDWKFSVVKTGDEVSLGKKTLRFIEAPMMHWPDNMFTYVKEDSLLLSNDAFGQHIASSQRFVDEIDEAVVWEEEAKYFANTLYPFVALIKRKLDEIKDSGIPIKTIAPSHGLIWRKEPQRILDKYMYWAEGCAKERVFVAYDTMWESTGAMARAIVDGVLEAGVEAKACRLSATDPSDVYTDVLLSKALVVGSSTVNNTVLPAMAAFLEELKGLRPKNKMACAFGSHGWGGGAVKVIEKSLQQAGIEVTQPGLGVRHKPSPEELKECVELGRRIAGSVKQKGN
ncbi:MAG: FprA family A-type flavoprotein [Planctomycetota bacterium]|jgi:flavorubredoxin